MLPVAIGHSLGRSRRSSLPGCLVEGGRDGGREGGRDGEKGTAGVVWSPRRSSFADIHHHRQARIMTMPIPTHTFTPLPSLPPSLLLVFTLFHGPLSKNVLELLPGKRAGLFPRSQGIHGGDLYHGGQGQEGDEEGGEEAGTGTRRTEMGHDLLGCVCVCVEQGAGEKKGGVRHMEAQISQGQRHPKS